MPACSKISFFTANLLHQGDALSAAVFAGDWPTRVRQYSNSKRRVLRLELRPCRRASPSMAASCLAVEGMGSLLARRCIAVFIAQFALDRGSPRSWLRDFQYS